MPPHTIAIAWLLKEDWPRWLAIDHEFPPDYNRWLRRIEELLAQFELYGTPFEKIAIDPDEFLDWSRLNGGEVDFKARAKFATALSKSKLANRKNPDIAGPHLGT